MASTATFAQTKGGLWFEGNLGFTSFSGTDHTTGLDKLSNSTFNIGAGCNYMLSDNWSVGLGLAYNHSSEQKVVSTAITKDLYNKANLFAVNPHADYFMKLTSKLTWAPRAYVDLAFGKEKDDYVTLQNSVATNDFDIFNMEFGIRPLSFDYALTNHVTFNFSMDIANLYYRMEKVSNDNYKDDETSNTGYFQFGKFSSNLDRKS